MVEFSGRLSKAPVVYALCQLRFAPVLKMRDLVPDIQDALRSSYENFDEEQIAGILVAGAPGTPPTVQTETRWRFERSDKRAGYVLQNTFLTYHTTAYSDFDEFVPEILRGFTAVADVAKIARIQRIGLRYVDLIEGDEDTPVDELIHPQLRGFGKELKDLTETLSQYIFKGSTGRGTLVFRATRGNHKTPLPPDLIPSGIEVVRTPNPSSPSIFLDTDHFIADSKTTAENLEEVVRGLKQPIGDAFKQAITQKALDEWK